VRVLAGLAASRERDQAPAGSIPLDWFHWLPAAYSSICSPAWPARPARETAADFLIRTAVGIDPHRGQVLHLDQALAERLAALDQVRTVANALRVGWLFVAGQLVDPDGRRRRVFQPLVMRPVRVGWSDEVLPRRRGLVPSGDTVVTPLVSDAQVRAELERRIEFGGGGITTAEPAIPKAFLARLTRLAGFAREVAAAAGLPATELIPAGSPPSELLERDHLVIVAGLAVYAVLDGSAGTSAAGALDAWATRSATWTAFHSLCLPERSPEERGAAVGEDDEEHDPVSPVLRPVSPFPLTPAQRRAVLASRHDPVTLVSGAPGTGKSHTIVAIACDALARGETVLVAARSEATVDALIELFERAPGPQPLVFGSSERKDALAEQLAAGRLRVTPPAEVTSALDRLHDAVAARDACYAGIASGLAAEQMVEAPAGELMAARVRWPRLFEPDVDLDQIGSLLALVAHEPGGWLERRRHRRAVDDFDELSGARDQADRRAFARVHRLARAERDASRLAAAGGLDLGPDWERLEALDGVVRDACARWLAADAHGQERLSPHALGAVAALATALRSGRSARRELLARVPRDLSRALPLWVGTLADIEDLLPRQPAVFDLVVLDEASSIDQPLAAPALLRGRRAVVVGDPRQLRHVSFLADGRRDAVLAANGIDSSSVLGTRLDVRRNSAFDVAAGVSPVIVLDEHFRCAPHLVDFVARRLYRGEVRVATRTPATQSIDCIEVVLLDGERDRAGVVQVEVDEVLRRLRRLAGVRSVGVVTPFRAQADALEQAILGAFDADDLEEMDLRIGTVHGFQGIERDVVLISLGVGRAGMRAWPFVEDPHLFTVLATRARRRLVVVTAGEPPPGGLVAEYLDRADAPPGSPRPVDSLPTWTVSLGDDLRAAGIPAVAGYPTGRHVVDLCVGDAAAFAGFTCMVHPEGPAAHIERHLSLRRAGWPLRDAFPSRWTERRGELLVELGRIVRRD
jgi:hypothetical protein